MPRRDFVRPPQEDVEPNTIPLFADKEGDDLKPSKLKVTKSGDLYVPGNLSAESINYKLDQLKVPDDTAKLNVTKNYHGLVPKLSGLPKHFFRGDGEWAEPEGVPPTLHVKTHQSGGDDQLVVTGLAGELLDPQKPKRHSSAHQLNGKDPIRLDELVEPEDTEKLNVSKERHGLCPKLVGEPSYFLNSEGEWVAPKHESLIEALGGDKDSHYHLTKRQHAIITDYNNAEEQDWANFGDYVLLDNGKRVKCGRLGMTKEISFSAPSNSILLNYPVLSIPSEGEGAIFFLLPVDVQEIESIVLLAIPIERLSNAKIAMYSSTGSVDKKAKNNSGSDSIVLEAKAEEVIEIDIKNLFASAKANDTCGLKITHNQIKSTVGYLGVRLRYR